MDDKTWIAVIDLAWKILAALAAAVWAVALYKLLLKRETAQEDLRKKQKEVLVLEKTSKHVDAQILNLELKAKQQAVVWVDIHPTIYHSPDGSGYLISAVVEITNRGSRNTKIRWKNQPPAFYVRLARFVDGKPEYDPVKEFRVWRTLNPNSDGSNHVIRAGGREALTFAVKVSTSGLYLLSFRGAVDPKEREEAKKLDVELPVAWTANRHVLVDDTSCVTGPETNRDQAPS